MRLPVFDVAWVFDSERLLAVTLTFTKMRITRLKLKINALAACLTLFILKLNLPINAPIAIGRRAKDMPGFGRNSESFPD
jgi:hypothetical protein